MNQQIRIFDDNAAIARFLGEKLAKLSHEKNGVYLALSGGNTPKAIFELWRREFADKIKWEHIYLFWGDERCVAPDDPESNFGMTDKALISHIPISENHVFRIQGELPPDQAAEAYQQVIDNQIPRQDGLPVFDIIFLGLGDDGHTVSIFPNQAELWESPNICEVATHPISGQKRITITGSIINKATEAIFLITGSSKRQVVHDILNGKGNYLSYPAARVTNNNTLWLLDKAAAEFPETK